MSTLIIILTVEKILQHALTALFFTVYIPGIGTPNIGPHFTLSNAVMTILNLLYTLIFSAGLLAKVKKLVWGAPLIIFLAALDIILEFVFHGFFYITVSVIVSTILIIAVIYQQKKQIL